MYLSKFGEWKMIHIGTQNGLQYNAFSKFVKNCKFKVIQEIYVLHHIFQILIIFDKNQLQLILVNKNLIAKLNPANTINLLNALQ